MPSTTSPTSCTSSSKRPRKVYTTYIAATPERVWQALTDPAFTQRYWSTTFDTDWRAGSRIVWHNHGVTIDDPEQVVLESEPPRRLSYTWHTFTPELATRFGWEEERLALLAAEPRSQITFELEPDDGLTKLTVIHDGFEPGSAVLESAVLESISGGWPRVIANLKTLLETGETLAA